MSRKLTVIIERDSVCAADDFDPSHAKVILLDASVTVEIRTEPKGSYGFIHFFAATREEMNQFVDVAATHSLPGGKIWLSYPFRAEALATHFRSELCTRKLAERGLSVSAQLPLDQYWIAFRLRHDEKPAHQGIRSNPVSAPRNREAG